MNLVQLLENLLLQLTVLSHLCFHIWLLKFPGLLFNRETAFRGQILPRETYYPLGGGGSFGQRADVTYVRIIEWLPRSR